MFSQPEICVMCMCVNTVCDFVCVRMCVRTCVCVSDSSLCMHFIGGKLSKVKKVILYSV